VSHVWTFCLTDGAPWDARVVLLTSSDGASVELRPIRYQFSAAPSEPGDWDANWLEIRGRVRTVAGESCEFEDPCLTTWEARVLGDWLQAAADGRAPVTQTPTEDSEELLTFTEPNLGFSVGGREGDSLVVCVHLSLESVADRPGRGMRRLTTSTPTAFRSGSGRRARPARERREGAHDVSALYVRPWCEPCIWCPRGDTVLPHTIRNRPLTLLRQP